MRFRISALIAVMALTLLMFGCNQTENDNRVVNANAHANSNTPIIASSSPLPNNNANDNTNTRRAPTREEYERDKDRYNREAKQSGRKVGTGLNDGWLWVKTRFDLAAVDDLRDSTINVDVDNEVVTLTGTVASAAQKAKAEQTAKAVEGVKGVKDMLKVVADTSKASPTPASKSK
ncbi:MAG TPA: BON domain-containing protein [Pyrinomonadaceae bacterium]|nr:BON domain-containing protein [Pyrinomonadaceae bacterium]